MRWKAICFFFLIILFVTDGAFSQQDMGDSATEAVALANSIQVYHHFLAPETGLYNGSEYPFSVYYPEPISQGNPFFHSTSFDSGTISYKGIIYSRVPLLFDVIKQELLINDPSGIYIIRLTSDQVDWFSVWGFHFIHVKAGEPGDRGLPPGFYEVLYDGKTAVYKNVLKKIKENGASATGLNTYTSNADTYYMAKGGQFYRVKNKKTLMAVFPEKKKTLQQWMRKKQIRLKKNMDPGLIEIASWMDGAAN